MIPRSLVVATVVALASLVGCSGPGPGPFQQPVPGAQSVTEWGEKEPVDVGPNGRGASSIDEVVEIIRGMQGPAFANAPVESSVDGDESDSAAVAYFRIIPQGDHPLQALDLRVGLVHREDGWHIASMEQRYHCSGEVATDFCQ